MIEAIKENKNAFDKFCIRYQLKKAINSMKTSKNLLKIQINKYKICFFETNIFLIYRAYEVIIKETIESNISINLFTTSLGAEYFKN